MGAIPKTSPTSTSCGAIETPKTPDGSSVSATITRASTSEPAGCIMSTSTGQSCMSSLLTARIHALTGVLDSYDGGQHQTGLEVRTENAPVTRLYRRLANDAEERESHSGKRPSQSAPEIATAVFADTDAASENLAPGMMELSPGISRGTAAHVSASIHPAITPEHRCRPA